jgi:hypothetical protein
MLNLLAAVAFNSRITGGSFHGSAREVTKET